MQNFRHWPKQEGGVSAKIILEFHLVGVSQYLKLSTFFKASLNINIFIILRWMIMYAEIFLWLFGASVNLILLLKLFMHPSLWSTTNSFIGFIFFLNFFYLLLQVFLVNDVMETRSANDAFVQGLENLFIDNFKSILCSTKYISEFIYSSSTSVIF